LLIIDRKYSLVVEVREEQDNNNKNNAISQPLIKIGLATYSNSKSTVLSYVSIFEGFWRQNQLYQQLKVHDKMQKEFINIAAHELRNPIQPILGLTEIVRKNEKDSGQKELLDVVVRNARKLKQLTEDVLDVTKIESNTFQQHKEEFNLNDLVSHTIQGYKDQIVTTANSKIKLGYNNENMNVDSRANTRRVIADKYRINQVISNLVDNSIKFTKEKGGTIIISIKDDDNDKGVTISVKDSGKGIDHEIAPRLFTKFATKSETGTGLGLFISKNIIEAHNGRIWAQNNTDGKGATFYFTLPLSK
jgi:two-component system sensor histidine kinase VicK